MIFLAFLDHKYKFLFFSCFNKQPIIIQQQSLKLLGQQIKKRYYLILGTSVINSPLSPLSLVLSSEHLNYEIRIISAFLFINSQVIFYITSISIYNILYIMFKCLFFYRLCSKRPQGAISAGGVTTYQIVLNLPKTYKKLYCI